MTNPSIDKTSRHSLSKSEILRGYRAFGRIFSRGKFVRSANVRCYYEIQREIPPYNCTVGFAVKKARSSVQRNRIRRQLRESFRVRKTALNALCAQEQVALRCVFLFDTRNVGREEFSVTDSRMSEIVALLKEKISV